MEKMELEQVRLAYEAPKLQLIALSVEDVIRTSSDADGGGYGDDDGWFN